MYLSPEAQRLLEDVRHAHEGLLERFHADEAHRRAFRAIYEALESACGDLDDERLQRSIDGGWSAIQVLVHLAEHDQQIEEASQRGIEHMIEHGLDHARGLWIARLPARRHLMLAAAIIALSYLIGSVPVAYLAGRTTRGVDIRELGSGNVGASNIWQSVSRALVVPVGLAQIGQGMAGILLARIADQSDAVQVCAGLAAIVANDWNPWLGFMGGRGIGQSIGFMLLVSPTALGLFIIISLIGIALRAIPQFVALGLMLAPLAAIVGGQGGPAIAGCGLLVALAMLKRLSANGWPAATEPRPQVWLYRLMSDRDVRDREAWVRRGLTG